MNSLTSNLRLIKAFKIVCRQIGMILIALFLATIFLGLTGYPPFAILKGLSHSLTFDIAGTIRWSAPLILAGLAICVTFKS